MVWDYYDGPRIGLADHESHPCFFSCRRDSNGEYTNQFELAPIDAEFLEIATEQWNIFRKWEAQYHLDEVSIDSHPGKGEINPRYDELENRIQEKINSLHKIRCLFVGHFRPLSNQDDLSTGVMKDLEVEWKVFT